MKKVLVFLMVLLLVSCQQKDGGKYEKLQKMNWLIGNWKTKLPEGTLTEIWTKANDSTFEGSSFFINEKDTIHFEALKLKSKEDDLIYSATVMGQNNDEAVDFKLTSETGNTFVFENPTHDYPQKISYKKIKQTLFIATISGKQQGKSSTESYQMTKE